jgi:hypothetical protein
MRLHDDECYCGWCGNGPQGNIKGFAKITDWLDNKMGKSKQNEDGSITAYCPNCGSLVSMIIKDEKLISFGPAGYPKECRPDFIMTTDGRGVSIKEYRSDLQYA